MKLFTIALSYMLPLAVLGASVTPGHVGLLSWQVNKPSREGVNEIEFPFSIANELEHGGWYMAMQFAFINRVRSGIIGYCGIQPRGIGQAAALFSVFGAGTEIIDHKHCKNGADGGPGISCFVTMNQYAIKTKYYIQIRRDKCDPRTWSAVITDKQGYVQNVGAWRVREDDGGINRFQMGFLEYTSLQLQVSKPS